MEALTSNSMENMIDLSGESDKRFYRKIYALQSELKRKYPGNKKDIDEVVESIENGELSIVN
jgi:hypothetical protein